MTNLDYSAIQAVRDLTVQQIPVGDTPAYVSVHKDHRIEVVQPEPPELHYPVESITIAVLDDWIEYVRRFDTSAASAAVVFAHPSEPRATAILDYHSTGEGPESTPGRCAHRVHWRPQLDQDWIEWNAIQGRYVPQREMLLFLEQMLPTIEHPSPDKVMSLVANLEVDKSTKFQSGHRLADGTRQLQIVEEQAVRSSIAVPDHLVLRMPVFVGAEPVTARALFRYKIDVGLSFRADLVRPQDHTRAAAEAAIARMRAELPGKDVYRGHRDDTV